MIITLLIILILVGATVGILAITGAFNTSSSNKNKQSPKPPESQQPYINPQPFKTGYLKDSPQPLADVCNKNMYPINPPYVDYGDPRYVSAINDTEKECDVIIFNSPP